MHSLTCKLTCWEIMTSSSTSNCEDGARWPPSSIFANPASASLEKWYGHIRGRVRLKDRVGVKCALLEWAAWSLTFYYQSF